MPIRAIDGFGRLKVLPANSNFDNPLPVANGGTAMVSIADGEIYVSKTDHNLDRLSRSTLTNRVLAKAAADQYPTWFDLANILAGFVPSPGSRPLTAPKVYIWQADGTGSVATTAIGGINVVSSGTVGSVADATVAGGTYLRLTGGASSGNSCQFAYDITGNGLNGLIRLEQECYAEFKFKTGTSIAAIRINLGLGASTPYNTETPAGKTVGIKFSTVNSDANWIAWASDSTTVGVTTLDTGVLVAVSTVYIVKIRVYAIIVGVSYAADITINGTTVTINIPTNALGTYITPYIGFITQAAAAKFVDVGRMALICRNSQQLS